MNDNNNGKGLINAARILSSLATPTPAAGGLGILAQAMNPPPQNALMTALMGIPPVPSAPWAYVIRRFDAFQQNLELTPTQIADGTTKYKGVVSCLNAAYWGHGSDTLNAFLIGSWAKGTRIRPPRDVDLYFILPDQVYHQLEAYGTNTNKQSALLQDVRRKLLATNPNSNIRGDGPVVLAGFTSYNVEVVPTFNYVTADRSFLVCDTKNGGRYMVTKPLHEVDAIAAADARSNGNARRLIRMLKCWQAHCSVPIKSFWLELLAVEFLDQSPWRSNDYFYYDFICRDFFAWLVTRAHGFVFAPGTFEIIWLGDAWKSRAESSAARALKACDYEHKNDMINAGDEWQKIFGYDIPRIV